MAFLIEAIKQEDKPSVKLLGEDGNAYAIMGRVRRAWRTLRRNDIVEEYTKRATASDYTNLLAVTMDYINEGNANGDEDDE